MPGAAFCAVLLVLGLPVPPAASAAACPPGANAVVCENALAGDPSSEWDISGEGDQSIQGFATDISVNKGASVSFKVKTTATAYRLDIYRVGYYGGMGARKVASVSPSAALPQRQPDCIDESATTGLVDCGNWAESASWAVPASAVSGVYFARLVRADDGGASHVMFVVRDDASTSRVLFQTSDTTWQAYNSWGDKPSNARNTYDSLNGRAAKVSYNRPFSSRGTTPAGRDFFFAHEYPMVRWLEANGYDTTYTTGIDSDRRGGLIKQHRLFMSTGHDEYWSGSQRANVEAARDAGVHLAFFSGNSVYWKTRWEPSVAAPATPYRTMVVYKETKANAKVDPDPAWTGTWRDGRFSPPSDGGRPENALMGTWYKVNTGEFSIEVPAADGQMRLWRNTSVANLAPGATAVLGQNTLGYEWDEDADNGFRPPGLIRMSSTTKNVAEYLYDAGNTVGPGTATHHLTLYRAPSGALVFGAGTIQWSWGLDDNHDGVPSATDVRIQQATVNLFADMGIQPASLRPGLVAASQTVDTAPPVAVITSPSASAQLANGAPVTVTGTASDSGGRVGGVEVSIDDGASWHPATGRGSWTYTGPVTGYGPTRIKARATDDSGNIQTTPDSVAVSVSCPCRIFSTSALPATPAANDTAPIEVGVKFRSDVDAWVTAISFYKGSGNTGTHVGSLWSASGTRLATTTFTSETPTGWQQAELAEPVPITAGTTYVASYQAPAGRYAADASYFGTAKVSPPLRALQNGADGGNGVYSVGGGGFPSSTYGAANYWVDVVVSTTRPPDRNPPTLITRSPTPGVSSVSVGTAVKAGFSEPVDPATTSFTLRDGSGALVAASVTYDDPTRTATLTPSGPLPSGTTFTAAVSGTKDLAGNPMAPASWSFTTARAVPPPGVCPCGIWNDTVVPAVRSSTDTSATEVGVKFRSGEDGFVDGIRFYKGPGNSGLHTASLWTSAGARLATADFAAESTEGWQEVMFAAPVQVSAATTYVASYFAPQGRYSFDRGYFATSNFSNPPLTALGDGIDGANGLYSYGAGFPSRSYGSANYWVDVVFRRPPDLTAPSVTARSPGADATNVQVGAPVKATFSEPVQPATVRLTLRDPSGAPVGAATTYDGPSRTSTLTPSAPLAPATRYTVALDGATDPAGNTMSPATWSFTTAGIGACPCTIWSTSTAPGSPSTNDSNPYELGVRFQSDTAGFITGVRFYKGQGNTGPHKGRLWSSSGQQLATADFTGESPTGWQQVNFSPPVAIEAGTTYVASYTTATGFYASDSGYFTGAGVENPPLRALAQGAGGPNGVYAPGSGFPNQSYGAANYWVDPVFTNVDTSPPTVTATSPVDRASSVLVSDVVRATFSEPVAAGTISFALKDASGALVGAQTAYDPATRTATLKPTANLAGAAAYTATVTGAADAAGNVMAAFSWSFTTAAAPPPPGSCPCTIWADSTVPATTATDDTSPIEVGVKFRADSDGYIYGVRFYKGVPNTGTHTGSLWSADGVRLATSTFSQESSTGWQQVSFDTPVAVRAGVTYVASYHAPVGRYALNGGYFGASATTNPPLRALASGFDGGNGVYAYGPSSFPTGTYGAANYWVDVVFNTVGDTTPPSVTAAVPVDRSAGVALDARPAATFSEQVKPGSISFSLRNSANAAVAGTTTYDPSTRTATFAPATYLGQGDTFSASVTADDLAGNRMTAPFTWTFATLADTVAPVISGVAATADRAGNATVTWTTDEPSDSAVDYGTSPANLGVSVGNGSLVRAHSVVLTGLVAGRTYYFRVTSRDPARNSAVSPAPPAAPASFNTPALVVADTSGADFSAGTVGAGAAVTYVGDGEVALAPAEGSEFEGSTVPGSWTTTPWAAGGDATVSGGMLNVDGARTGTTATYPASRALEFVATFDGTANQHAGFGVDYNTTSEWAMFSTKDGSGTWARSRTGSKALDTLIPGVTTGVPHRYRIDWTATQAVFSVDGVVKVTHDIAIPVAMRPLVSDLSVGGGKVSVDWLRMTPYADSGSFTSRVLDSGSAGTTWGDATWNAEVPAGTTMVVSVRTGGTATPDATWSAWKALAGPGPAPVGGASRYIQYRVELSRGTVPDRSPVLADIAISYSP